MTIGERIKRRRIELGLSQIELAKRMGLSSKSTICQLENCGDNITTDRIKRAAEALDVSTSVLMGWDEIKTEDNATMLARLTTNPKMLEYIKKMNTLPLKNLENVYKFIDFECSQVPSQKTE